MCWEVFLDDESLIAFQTEQKAVHARRMAEEGLPGYIDSVAAEPAQATSVVHFTLFPEGRGLFAQLKVGAAVRVAPAGPDRKPTIPPLAATVTAVTGAVVSVRLPTPVAASFQPTGVARLWPGTN
jgi:hypothetical protein